MNWLLYLLVIIIIIIINLNTPQLLTIKINGKTRRFDHTLVIIK